MSRTAARKRKPKPKRATQKRATGRPTLYCEEFAEQAVKLCRLGATDCELAEFFGVDVATLNCWKLRHAGFCAPLKGGKSRAGAEVADRIYRRALGYSHRAVKIMQDTLPVATRPVPAC